MTPPRFSRRQALALAGTGLASLAGCADSLASAGEPDYGTAQFEEAAAAFGFEYEYVDDGANRNMKSLVSSAGVYAADVDNDGLTDVLALGGEEPVLFRNTGDGFEQSDALPAVDGEVSSALFLDYDNDGWDELLLLRLDATPVFLDNEGGEFAVRDVGFDEAFDNPVGASTADADGNGFLDVYVIQNGNWDGNRPARMNTPGGAPDPDNGKPNALYRGDGESFERATDAGLDDTRWTLASSFVDLTGDGAPDIYVANDYNYDILYANDGTGSFEMREVDSSNRNAMSATVADVTGDGRLDVFVTNIYFDTAVEQALDFLPAKPEGNNLFVNGGDGELTDRASEYGVRAGGWGWAATFADFTNSGSASLFHTTTPLGAEHTIQQETGQSLEHIYEEYPYLVYPMFYERTSEGVRTDGSEGSDGDERPDPPFTARHPPDLGFEQGDGRGVVAMDVTDSGTLDLVVADMDGPYRVYENATDAGNWLRVAVEPAPEMTAVGTGVTVSADGDQFQVVGAEADFLSQEPRPLHFGVGPRESVGLTVVAPDGTTHEFSDVAANQRVTVTLDGSLETE